MTVRMRLVTPPPVDAQRGDNYVDELRTGLGCPSPGPCARRGVRTSPRRIRRPSTPARGGRRRRDLHGRLVSPASTALTTTMGILQRDMTIGVRGRPGLG